MKRRNTIFISGPANMRSWNEGEICQAGPTCWLGEYPELEYCIPEKPRCDLEDVWTIIRWVEKRFGRFKVEGGNIVAIERRHIRRRRKSKTTMLPKDNWSAIFVAKDGSRFFDGVIALLVGAEYIGDYPNGTYNILQEPRIKLEELNTVLNYVNKQFPNGWRVEGKEIVAGKPAPVELPERRLPEWERQAKAREAAAKAGSNSPRKLKRRGTMRDTLFNLKTGKRKIRRR